MNNKLSGANLVSSEMNLNPYVKAGNCEWLDVEVERNYVALDRISKAEGSRS